MKIFSLILGILISIAYSTNSINYLICFILKIFKPIRFFKVMKEGLQKLDV